MVDNSDFYNWNINKLYCYYSYAKNLCFKTYFETDIKDLIIKDLNNLQLVNKIEDQIINETNKKNYQNNFKVSDFTFEYEISNNNFIISSIVRSTYPELNYEIAKICLSIFMII